MQIRIWILAVFLMSLTMAVPAQSYLGVSGGGGFRGQVIFRAGVPLEVTLNGNVHLQLEAAYVQRENRFLLGILPSRRKYLQPVLTYVEMPVLLKWRLPFEVVDFFLLAGPQVGYALRLSSTFEEDKLIFAESLNFSESGVNRLDAGLLMGVGLEKVIAQRRKIFLDLRYYLGLYNIHAGSGEAVYNSGATFALGFLIPLH